MEVKGGEGEGPPGTSYSPGCEESRMRTGGRHRYMSFVADISYPFYQLKILKTKSVKVWQSYGKLNLARFWETHNSLYNIVYISSIYIRFRGSGL